MPHASEGTPKTTMGLPLLQKIGPLQSVDYPHSALSGFTRWTSTSEERATVHRKAWNYKVVQWHPHPAECWPTRAFVEPHAWPGALPGNATERPCSA